MDGRAPTHNLIFLLGLTPLGLGCIITSDDDDTDGAATAGTATGGTGMDSGDTGMDSGDTGADSGDTGVATADTGADAAESGDIGMDTGDGTAGTGGEVATCVAYAETVALCEGERFVKDALNDCATALQDYYDMYGADCATVYEEFLACLTALDCREFTSKEPACVPEAAALGEACTNRGGG